MKITIFESVIMLADWLLASRNRIGIGRSRSSIITGFKQTAKMLGLIRELELEDKVRFPRPFTVMLYKKLMVSV